MKKVIVHWDYENCPIRNGVDCEFMCNVIRTALLEEQYIIKDINVYMRCNETSTKGSQKTEKDLVTRFNHMGVNVVNCSSTKMGKEIVDKKMMSALWNCLDDNETTVAIITRDCDYCETLNKLRNRGIKTLVFGDENSDVPIPRYLMYSSDKNILISFNPADDSENDLKKTDHPSDNYNNKLSHHSQYLLKTIQLLNPMDDKSKRLKSMVASNFYSCYKPHKDQKDIPRKKVFNECLQELKDLKKILFDTQHITLL